MSLDPATERRIRAAAEGRGVDPDEAVAEAERLASSDPPPTSETSEAATGRPIADRLLIGFLPFITVQELRTHFLKLPARIKDDELTCGEFQAKYAGSLTASPSTTPVPGSE